MYETAIKKLKNEFGFYLYPANGRYVGCCPIHGGDNQTAFNINVHTGYWFCNTKKCHEIIGNTFEDFTKLLLYTRSGEIADDEELGQYFANNNIFYEHTEYAEQPSIEFDLPLSALDEYDLGNCAYFLNRGFTKETLKKFMVFTCPDPKKKLYNLCVVPILNVVGDRIVATTARMPWNECLVCGKYHNPQDLCLNMAEFQLKWRHEPKGFKKGNRLYNIWNSWRYIKQWKDIIIVESPSNVWRLDQCGFHNSVALLGSSMSKNQKELIDKLNPDRVFVIGDNDDAGHKMMESISGQYKNASRIEINNYNDIAEMQDNEVKDLIWQNIHN